MKDFCCSLIGCGAISHVHLQALRAKGVKVAALCDVKRERAEAAAAEYAP